MFCRCTFVTDQGHLLAKECVNVNVSIFVEVRQTVCWYLSRKTNEMSSLIQWHLFKRDTKSVPGFDAWTHGLACNGLTFEDWQRCLPYYLMSKQTMLWQRSSWYNLRFMKLKRETRFIFTHPALETRWSGFDGNISTELITGLLWSVVTFCKVVQLMSC